MLKRLIEGSLIIIIGFAAALCAATIIGGSNHLYLSIAGVAALSHVEGWLMADYWRRS